jgi:cadmium resistance protein CadD (predicted permease)
MLAGLPAEIGMAAGAFVATNIDNGSLALAMVASAAPGRTRRIAYGQFVGFVLLVIAAAATAIALFDVPTRAIGLLGLVPLALGIRGLFELRHHQRRRDARQRADRRAFGRGVTTAALVSIGAGGDNLAVYIPLFRVASTGGLVATALVFTAGEALLTVLILSGRRHPRTRALSTRVGMLVAPLLYCGIGALILIESRTISFFG